MGLKQNCEDIVFFEDGSWRPLEDIQQGQDSAKPLAEVLNTPKSSNKPKSVEGCETPPVLSINTPETSNITNSTPTSVPNVPPMPTLDFRPRVTHEEPTTNGEQTATPEEDVEIIMIDDSDSES